MLIAISVRIVAFISILNRLQVLNKQRKTISNDQELLQSDSLYPALKNKREITKYINWQQFTKGTRGKPNEQLFPRQVVIQLPKLN